ncbi:hypothetical protein SALBM135S_04299 [Streptomyces alboniger]
MNDRGAGTWRPTGRNPDDREKQEEDAWYSGPTRAPADRCTGAWGSGRHVDDAPYTAADIAHAAAAVEAALDIGITAFDHADIYRRGKAEAVFGEVLARAPELRARVVLQTKCGIRQADGGLPGMYDLRARMHRAAGRGESHPAPHRCARRAAPATAR